MSKNLAGAGWYEFLRGDESHTIRIFENGDHYIPNPEVITIQDLIDAVNRGEAWRLVRTEATTDKPVLRLVKDE